MKLILGAAALFGLASCNTTIGIYRDVKVGVKWTANKVQGMNSGGDASGYDSTAGAADDTPIY
ncbi:MAG: hypothetical protein V4733_05635 [Verrucomicrobiota bacterium]